MGQCVINAVQRTGFCSTPAHIFKSRLPRERLRLSPHLRLMETMLYLDRVTTRQSFQMFRATHTLVPTRRSLATLSSRLDIANEIKMDHSNVRDLFKRRVAS